MIEFSEIQSEEGMYRAIGRRVVQLIEGELEFAAKKSGKGKGGANKKDCKKGISCGSSCVAKTKACVSEMSASQKKRYYALLRKVKKGGVGGGEAQAEIDKIIADQVAAKTGQQTEPVPVATAKAAASPGASNSIPSSDPFDPELSQRNALGRELSYAGVTQDTTNSRIFGARGEIPYFSQYDTATQVGWLNDHVQHMNAIKGSKEFVDRANYEFAQIWSKANPEAKKQVAERWADTKNPVVKSLLSEAKPVAEAKPKASATKEGNSNTKGANNGEITGLNDLKVSQIKPDVDLRKAKEEWIQASEREISKIDVNTSEGRLKAASLGFARDFANVLDEPGKFPDYKEYAVRDRSGKIQAIMQATIEPSGFFRVEGLASHPDNIVSAKNAVKGAGTSAIVAAIKESQRLGYEGRVSLMAAPFAFKFYEKLGFENVKGTRYELSPSAAQKLLTDLGV